jgi:ribosomal protein S12 methylthiotransferase accessory factor
VRASEKPRPQGAKESKFPLLYRAELGKVPKGSRSRAGVGKGTSQQEALAGAIAEALERYCSLCPNELQISRGNLAELGNRAIDPREFVLYSRHQYDSVGFPYAEFDKYRHIAWRDAHELPDRAVYKVPASLIYLAHSPKSAGDSLTTATSNGLAAGEDLDSAVLGGILELIERDSFLITWMNCLPVDQLDLPDLGAVEFDIVEHYRRFGIYIRIYLLPTDIPVHVMMAVSRDEKDRPPVTAVGLGCSLNPRDAARKALFELCQTRHGETWRYWNSEAHQRIRAPTDIVSPTDHSGFYASRLVPEAFAFLDDGLTRSFGT